MVSSSIPNSERAKEAERGGGKEFHLRLLSTTTSDVSRGLDVNIRSGFFFFRRRAKRTDDRVGEIGHPQRERPAGDYLNPQIERNVRNFLRCACILVAKIYV